MTLTPGRLIQRALVLPARSPSPPTADPDRPPSPPLPGHVAAKGCRHPAALRGSEAHSGFDRVDAGVSRATIHRHLGSLPAAPSTASEGRPGGPAS